MNDETAGLPGPGQQALRATQQSFSPRDRPISGYERGLEDDQQQGLRGSHAHQYLWLAFDAPNRFRIACSGVVGGRRHSGYTKNGGTSTCWMCENPGTTEQAYLSHMKSLITQFGWG